MLWLITAIGEAGRLRTLIACQPRRSGGGRRPPLVGPLRQVVAVAGAVTTPATGAPLWISAMLTVKLSRPSTKPRVPSSGSISQNHSAASAGAPCDGHGLLGHGLHAGIQRLQPGQDQGLGFLVGLGHRAVVGLGLRDHAVTPEGQDDAGGVLGDVGQGLGQGAGLQVGGQSFDHGAAIRASGRFREPANQVSVGA
jgi:hypothetical protein